ncbi:MAG: Na+/H+ antiporter NhaC family protein, partial [Longimicrobiales bacterium]
MTFRLGVFGALLPVLLFLGGVGWLGFSGAPDERGLWPVLLASLGLGLVLSKDSSEYSGAVVRGMARPIVMLMVMAWLLAGVFSVVLRESGLIHSLIWLAGEAGLSGGTFVLAVLGIAMLFATATGTSLGTIIICAPLLYPASSVLEARPEMVMGAILAGATFGDNISPVSDTTIASANSQEAPMGGVVRSRLKYAVPAALVAAAFFLAFGGTGTTLERAAGRIAGGAHPANLSGDPVALPMLLAPVATFLMLWRRKGLLTSLFVGVATAILLALVMGLIGAGSLIYVDKGVFRAQGLILDGMESSIGIVVFTLLLMGVVGALEETGILERLLARDSGATGPRRAELR